MSGWEDVPEPRKAVAPAQWEDVPDQSLADNVLGAINTGVNWLGTRATKAATGIAGSGRAFADLIGAASDAAGLPPAVATAIKMNNPVSMVGQFIPTSETMNQAIFGKVAPEVNLPGKLGHAADVGVESVLGAAAMPGNLLRSALPAFAGGASQELVGNAPGIQGTKWEPLARILTGVGVGGATALGQNAVGNAGQMVRNIMPNVDATAAKMLGRAATADQTTLPELVARQAELGPGATLVEAGGPNVRGALRGAITAPGAARTAAQEAFDTRRAQVGDMASAALDRNISPNGSVAATVDELSALQRQASGPAYEAAGVPRRPEMISPERTIQFSVNEPPTTIPAQWNTRTMESDALTGLLRDSSVVRSAMGQIRGLSDYKNVPTNTMTMWDQVYKVLGGMEREAARAGNDRRAMLIGDERRKVLNAITEINPRYQRALDAFSGPERLKEAAERGKEWFRPSIDPTTVAREFQALPPASQEAARVGVRDWARSLMGRTDRASTGATLWDSPDVRAKVQAILGPGEFADLDRQMRIVKNAVGTAADIGVGSRTAPMLAEQADNLAQIQGSGLADLLLGRPVRAAGKFLGSAAGRLTEGRTEAVNARLAEYLTATDPAKVGLVNALAEKARLRELAVREGRRDALRVGGVTVPALVASSRGDR